jgi:hypothetical protein
MRYGILATDDMGMLVRLHVQDGTPTEFATLEDATLHIAVHEQDIKRSGFWRPVPIQLLDDPVLTIAL